MKQQLLSLGKYHLWAFDRLFESLRRVPDEDYRSNAGLFFTSIHGTLNHLLLADRVWQARFTGTAFSVSGLDQELEPDRAALEDQIRGQCRAWGNIIGSHPDAWTGESLVYRTSSGVESRTPVGKTLLHVFNHGTHHRGQISAVISRLGFQVPEMDYIYYIRENE